MTRIQVRALAFVATLAAALPAPATTLVRANVSELTTRSPVVVRAVVRAIQARQSADKRHILTDVDVEVLESIKGSPAQTLRITQPGGELNGIGQVVSGLPSFKVGEEVVLFLEHHGGAAFIVAGMAQGKYLIDRAGPTVLARPTSMGSATLVDETTRNEVVAPTQALTLDTLRSQVKAAAAKQPSSVKSGTGKTP